MRILVADDDAVNRRLLQSFLTKWGYEVLLASDGAEAWKILQQEKAPQLAILDWMMPGMDGVDICHMVRSRSERSYVYLILLTAKSQKQDIVAGLEAGADDYLRKPFDPNELRARLRAGRRILELQEELVAARDSMEFQATHDCLTGLRNRAAILETVRTELARARREGTSVAIFLADLDHFKLVNDTYGHQAGDGVLREVGKRMRSSVRSYDTVGRYGGEEFLIVLPGCDISGAMIRAEALRMAVGREPIETPEGMVAVTMSVGVTVGGGVPPSDVERLLRAADVALYHAKNKGRNKVEAFQEDGGQFPGSPPQKSGMERALAGEQRGR